jgi:hypothetical protein
LALDRRGAFSEAPRLVGGTRGPRRIWAALALAAVAAALGVSATARSQARTEVAVSWDVAEAGLDGESVMVYVQLGGCVGPPLRPLVEETATSIKLMMLATSVAGPDVVCTAQVKRGLTRVALAGALNGRSIRGRRGEPTGISLRSYVDPPGPKARVRVPVLTGLSSYEARRALRLRGLRVRVRASRGHGGRTQIRGQSPAGGKPIAPGGLVRLLVGLP